MQSKILTMKTPDIPTNESERLTTLDEYHILDTLPAKEFDDITKIASQICQTPISLISLVDKRRQWFKSHHGLSVSETPRDVAFCAHAINNKDEILIVPDSRNDTRFFDNPLVTDEPKVIFYTGVPLVAPNGCALGTLCVIDSEPKQLNTEQLDSLKSLANQVISLFELHIKNIQLEEFKKKLQARNSELEKFAYIVSHDIKSPLANIISFAKLLQTDYSAYLNEKGLRFLDYINQSALKLKSFVDGILDYYRSDQSLKSETEEIDFTKFIQSIISLVDMPTQNCHFIYPENNLLVNVNKIALEQVFLNLITNAIKYNNKKEIIITITLNQNEHFYNFSVSDNGIGIAKENIDKVFDLFKHLDIKDRFGNYGTGIGLATVKKIIENNGGIISLQSSIDEGTLFSFSLKKPF